MGSFNTTCFASNQTIASGDKCRVMPIIQQATYNPAELTQGDKKEEAYGVSHSTCYSTAFWRPVASFIPAEYDDYGRVTLLFDPLTRAKLFSFFYEVLKSCPNVTQGENTYHEHPFDFRNFLEKSAPKIFARLTQKSSEKEPLSAPDELDTELTACWDYVFEVASEHRLFMRNYQSIVRQLQFSVMHEEAYQALIAEMTKHKSWEGVSYDPTTFLEHAVKQAHAQAAERVVDGDKHDMKAFWFADAIRSEFSVFTREGGYNPLVESHQIHVLASKAASGELTDEALVQKLLPFLADKYALSGLEEFNLKLSPLIYAGQDYHNEMGSAYAKFVSAVSQKVSRGRKVHYFGEAKDYRMEVSGQAQLDQFIELMRDADSYVESVEILSKAPSETSDAEAWVVKFSCPADIEDLKEIVMKSLPDSTAMAESFSTFEKA